MAENDIGRSRLEQRSIIKFCVAENSKPFEIYRKIYDVHGETCLKKSIKKKEIISAFTRNDYKETFEGYLMPILSL